MSHKPSPSKVRLILVLVTSGLINLAHCTWPAESRTTCGLFDTKGVFTRNSSQCASRINEPGDGSPGVYYNVPILTAVHCFNNGTGICKVLAGRFEFYFNSWTQTYLGPVTGQKYVDEYGYHERVPVSYSVDGSVVHADRSINWSLYFTKTKPRSYNLLSATSFNWCKYVETNNWPYKSAILDHNKNRSIYFYNRQSCINHRARKELQHYNTRFLYISNLRIDLDYNPTIFTMENKKVKEVRLVKHMRQHWTEMKWELLENPRPLVKYFVKMTEADRKSLMLDGNGGFIRRQFFENHTNLCISDYYGKFDYGRNSPLLESKCGTNQVEVAVYGKVKGTGSKPRTSFLYEIGLHTIPRWPVEIQSFYGVRVESDDDWKTFAKDGYSFSASTTIPIKENTFEVITLFSWYKAKAPDEYDENYPQTYLARYNMTFNGNRWTTQPNLAKTEATKKANLNYVDDIAYLPLCNTILVIFGPLYTEFPRDQFNLETRTPLSSIYYLGANEMINAFFAVDNKLYFYHRTNFIAEHQYTCKSDSEPLVTATKVGNYHYRYGPGRFDFMAQTHMEEDPRLYDATPWQEEREFLDLGIFKGSLGLPDAPDATKYPWSFNNDEIKNQQGLPWWVWLLVVLGMLLLLVMFVLGFMTFRRRRRRRFLEQTKRSELPSAISSVSGARTARSAFVPGSTGTPASSTRRSGALSSQKLGPTRRSSIGGASRSNRSNTSTGRSSLSGRKRGEGSQRSLSGRGATGSQSSFRRRAKG